MNEEEVLRIAQEALAEENTKQLKKLFAKEEMYILLSWNAANLLRGLSVPYIGTLKTGERMLVVFTSMQHARDYIDKNGYYKPGDNYMIGKMEKNDKLGNLYAVCNTARQLGIYGIDIDPGSEDAMGCEIDYLFTVNNLEPTNVSVISSEEDMAKILKENDGNLPIHFNMMPILNYINPYEISKKRSEVLLGHVFNAGRTLAEAKATFTLNENLNENVFVADMVNRNLIAQAKKNNKASDVQYFQSINNVLERVVWERLANEDKLYTLHKGDTDELFTVNDCMYVLYTDYFKSMGSFVYKQLRGREEIEKMIKEHNIKGLLVTDGPSKMIVLEEPVITSK